MKTRNGFVSNSSSSSFMIRKSDLTEEQMEGIRSHGQSQYFKQHGSEGDEWDITENELTICGYTFMDNFCMSEYMQNLGISPSVVRFED